MRLFSLLLLIPISAANAAAPATPSPAEAHIQAAENQIHQKPGRFQAYNDLALALVRRERETGDPAYFSKAEAAVEQSLKIQPDNFEGQQARVAILLGERRDREALDLAQKLNLRMHDNVLVWTYMAYAAAALGDYDKAETWAQWAMDLRPGNVPAYLCGAKLREDWGDAEGALDFLGKALQETPPFETEETAWILTSIARVHRISGKPDLADTSLAQALKIFPGYDLALEELARVRMAQHRYDDAVQAAQTRNRNFATPASQYLEAEALERAGRREAAHAAFAEFEKDARARIDQWDNANRELVLYYADRDRRPEEAVRIAKIELARRHDARTLDAEAWALFVAGDVAGAKREIGKAVAVGTRDSMLLYHAGEIAAAAGDRSAASRYLKQSLDLDPSPEVAGVSAGKI